MLVQQASFFFSAFFSLFAFPLPRRGKGWVSSFLVSPERSTVLFPRKNRHLVTKRLVGMSHRSILLTNRSRWPDRGSWALLVELLGPQSCTQGNAEPSLVSPIFSLEPAPAELPSPALACNSPAPRRNGSCRTDRHCAPRIFSNLCLLRNWTFYFDHLRSCYCLKNLISKFSSF